MVLADFRIEKGIYPIVRQQGDIQYGAFEIMENGYHVKIFNSGSSPDLKEKMTRSEFFEFIIIIDFTQYNLTLVGLNEYISETRLLTNDDCQSYTEATFRNAYISESGFADFNAIIVSGWAELSIPMARLGQINIPTRKIISGLIKDMYRMFDYRNLNCAFSMQCKNTTQWNASSKTIHYCIDFKSDATKSATKILNDITQISNLLSLAFGEPIKNSRIILKTDGMSEFMMLPIKDELHDGSRNHLSHLTKSLSFSIEDEYHLRSLFRVFENLEKFVPGFASHVFNIRFSKGHPEYRFMIACGLLEQFFKNSDVLALLGERIPEFNELVALNINKMHPKKKIHHVEFEIAWKMIAEFYQNLRKEQFPHNYDDIKRLRNSFAHGADPGPLDLKQINSFSWLVADIIAAFIDEVFVLEITSV